MAVGTKRHFGRLCHKPLRSQARGGFYKAPKRKVKPRARAWRGLIPNLGPEWVSLVCYARESRYRRAELCRQSYLSSYLARAPTRPISALF